MAGKGSKRRPIDPKLERKVFEDNWDRIFKKKKDMWDHHCKHNGFISIQVGQACNWCGMNEDGTLD